ncbi:hypothetical protein Pla163_19990 [Planctomycetes bacterium Pla163]|uniref:Uncharacterized protein n=1 Tax=Rohdeia mirabilis TaxID=2528008 RepID=A0A518D073_9BACT|nr:hypothetical protein Pla163_19990 [Planctomycetes bacterium Pla163]
MTSTAHTIGSAAGPLALPTRADAIAALERCLAWLVGTRDDAGRLICPDHRIEHTGKSACVAILALELYLATGDANHLATALGQGRRLVARLEREGTSPCHTFRPGRHDPFNCSNSVIDGGACSDALASLCLELGDELGPDDRAAFSHAALLHADTYLKYACRDKGVPAQRAWALTGLASAWALDPRDEWKDAVLEALDLIAGVQRGDGSYPYHPLDWGAGHPGAADASSFYQSRVTGFSLFALERLGIDPTSAPHAERLASGLRFLEGLVGPDGIKCGLLEAKPWYWGAGEEVASNPFDVHALSAGARTFDERSAERRLAARRSLAAWIEHLEPSGRPTSHRPGPGRGRSYQCATFWAAHACWAARALRDWPETDAPDVVDPGATGLTWFADAELARFDAPGLVAWVRGARPPGNAMHGSPCGNGPIRVVALDPDGRWREQLPRCRLGGANSGEWNGVRGPISPRRGWRAGGADQRFSLWLARVAWRRGARLDALAEPLRHLRRDVLAFAHPRVSSGFARQVASRVDGDVLELTAALAWRDGTAVPNSRVVRRYRIADGALEVEERLLDAGGARDVEHRLPTAARPGRDPLGGSTKAVSDDGTRCWSLGPKRPSERSEPPAG